MSRVSGVSGVSGYIPVQLATRLLDWSVGGLLRCTVLPVCPCVVSFFRFHEPYRQARLVADESLASLFDTSDRPNFLVTFSDIVAKMS